MAASRRQHGHHHAHPGSGFQRADGGGPDRQRGIGQQPRHCQLRPGAFFINTRTDYAADSGAGVASSVLTVASSPILNGNSCGVFGTPTVITGAPTQSGLTDGCYLYTLTGTRDVGNTSTVSTTVKYDTAAPTQAATLTTGLGAAQTGNVIYFRPTSAGSFTLTDAVTDSTTAPATATFPLINTTGWTHPAETVVTGSGTPPTTSYTSTGYSWAANASIPGTYTVLGSDVAGNRGQQCHDIHQRRHRTGQRPAHRQRGQLQRRLEPAASTKPAPSPSVCAPTSPTPLPASPAAC